MSKPDPMQKRRLDAADRLLEISADTSMTPEQRIKAAEALLEHTGGRELEDLPDAIGFQAKGEDPEGLEDRA